MLTLGDLGYLDNARVLITGGTGSLGRTLARMILDHSRARKVIVYSRDEFKQYEMQGQFSAGDQQRMGFFLGDVRDEGRLRRAFHRVDYVIHAAALKQVPAAEYNPFEFVKTNIQGAENVINAAIDCKVRKVVALSTDKAANPINLYGATKLCSDKLFVSGNSYSGPQESRFGVVRYGNVLGSRGSVVPFFLARRHDGVLPITDQRMTRFWITKEQGAALVLNSMRVMSGGEIFVPKIPSMRITDMARAIAPEARWEEIGIRPGEKLHEVMISEDDARETLELDSVFVIQPSLHFWDACKHAYADARPCAPGFRYSSDANTEWADEKQIAEMIKNLDLPEAKAWAKERGLA